MKQVIDLTWGLSEGMPNHPAHPVAPKLLSGTMTHKGTAIWMAKSTAYGQVSFASEQFLLAAHLGTHLDAPYHANPDGPTVEGVDLSYTCGDASLVRFINSRGQDKCVWGTDYPLLLHAEALEQIEALGLKETAKRKLLNDNAARIFKL